MKILATVLLSVLCGLQAFSIENDSIKPKIDSLASYYYHNNIDSIYIPKLIHIDTILNGSQKYDPLKKWHRYYASLGNIGLAYNQMLYIPSSTIGFDYGLHSFDRYRFTYKNNYYYENIIPYTEVFYVMGRNKEHFLELTHNQNVIRNLSVGMNFRLINSPGFYSSQKSDNSSLTFMSKFTSKNKRYKVLANYTHNGIKVQENGGIQNDSVFDENQESNRKIIEVNLTSAMRRYKETAVFVQNSFKLSKDKTIITDTNIISEAIKPKLFNPGNISYTFVFNRKIISYEDYDPTNGFYENIYNDSLLTHDSTAIIKFENTIAWSNYEKYDRTKNNFLNTAFGITLRNIKLTNDTIDYQIHQLVLSAKASKSIFKTLIIHLGAEYILGDYNQSDYFMKGQINWQFDKKNLEEKLLYFKIGFINQKPDWLYQRHFSNNFIWNATFDKQQVFSTGLSLRIKTFSAKLNYYNMNSFLYFDKEALPAQNDKSVNVITASVFKYFKVGKFNFDNEITYQYNGNSNVLRLPDLVLNHSIYFNLSLFKQAVSTQTGIDIFYNTAYYSNAYMPATGVFYIQDYKKIGNYPYIDLFVNIQIKRAMIFAKYEHINKGLFNYNYYMTPHYPMPDGAFKFGVKWKFYN